MNTLELLIGGECCLASGSAVFERENPFAGNGHTGRGGHR